MISITCSFNNAEQTIWGGRGKKNDLLTERYTSRELINGRLWHAVCQHPRELGREKRQDSIYYNKQGSKMCLETAEYPQISVRSRWTRWQWSLWSWSGGARRDESGGTRTWRDGNRGIVSIAPAWNELDTEFCFVLWLWFPVLFTTVQPAMWTSSALFMSLLEFYINVLCVYSTIWQNQFTKLSHMRFYRVNSALNGKPSRCPKWSTAVLYSHKWQQFFFINFCDSKDNRRHCMLVPLLYFH